MRKASLKSLFDDDRFVLIFAVAASVVSWITVAMTTEQTIEMPIRNVNVNLEMQAGILKENGLIAIGTGEVPVEVLVSGQRTIVGQVYPEDLVITARVSDITEPDTYDLTLISGQRPQNYSIVKITPSTIRVRLDQISSIEIPIIPVVKGVSTPPDYMQDIERVSPTTVRVTGPLSELQKIDRCEVRVELDESLSKNYSTEVPIILLDVVGNEINPKENNLSMDHDTATVVVPVLRIKQLPIQISFTNMPINFPEDEFREYMVLSDTDIMVAGPVTTMNNYNELRLGYIDLRTITKENSAFYFDVTLPSDQFTNMDNVSSVKVEFDTEGWSSAAFNIRNIATFDKPLGYDVTLLTNSISNVVFVGPEEIIDNLAADDIVAEVYLSDRELTPGQSRYPIHLSAPTKGLVWPAGEYTVIIQVVETESPSPK